MQQYVPGTLNKMRLATVCIGLFGELNSLLYGIYGNDPISQGVGLFGIVTSAVMLHYIKFQSNEALSDAKQLAYNHQSQGEIQSQENNLLEAKVDDSLERLAQYNAARCRAYRRSIE